MQHLTSKNGAPTIVHQINGNHHTTSTWIVLLEQVGKVNQREREDRTEQGSDLGDGTHPHQRFAALVPKDGGDREAYVADQSNQDGPGGDLELTESKSCRLKLSSPGGNREKNPWRNCRKHMWRNSGMNP